MVGVYFSGTGNSKYCVEKFLQEYDRNIQVFSIEEESAVTEIKKHQKIVIGYPTQYSNIPKILKEFITANQDIWRDKEVFIIVTRAMFCGDGAGMLARLLKKYGAVIIGGLHLKMPDSICDEKVLKRTAAENKKLIAETEMKIKNTAAAMKRGDLSHEGLGLISHLAGLFGQRLYFFHKTKRYSDKLKIDRNKCIGCGKCEDLCPMKNIYLTEKHAIPGKQCTMCYRCVNQCPVQAITLLGKQVIKQYQIEQ